MEKNQKNSSSNKENENKLPDYAVYSGLAFQMIAVIGLSAWGGTALDEYFGLESPWFTIGLCLLGIFASLYLTLKQLLD